jgi:hypothetical protein
VLIEGNLFERNSAHSQNGFAILFTVRNQDGTAPWSVVGDATFRKNIVRHSGSGINILGFDHNYPSGSQHAQRIAIGTIYALNAATVCAFDGQCGAAPPRQPIPRRR